MYMVSDCMTGIIDRINSSRTVCLFAQKEHQMACNGKYACIRKIAFYILHTEYMIVIQKYIRYLLLTL